ncbi:MAG: hypothetical protein K2X27_22690, partial [Candidatus Obscuribacterales bacterium]|nr:hypothetical protein [Candidatus Obscuribacterales bacterium]
MLTLSSLRTTVLMSFKKLMALIVCTSLCSPAAFCANSSPLKYSDLEAFQAAEILGVKKDFERLRSLQNDGAPEAFENELLSIRAQLLRKILLGFIQVRQASNRTEVELSYAYDIFYREQRKEKSVLEGLNLINFGQLAVLGTIGPYSRINKQFKQSSILGLVGAGLGISLPITSLLYSKYHKISDIEPPKFLKNSLDGAAVDAENLPTYVNAFLNYPEIGDSASRKEEMFAFWKRNYNVDPADKETLGGINDNKHRTLDWLNRRIILLWSLRNQIQLFDRELKALSDACRSPSRQAANTETRNTGLSVQAAEAANLLKIHNQVAELLELNRQGVHSVQKLQLEATVLESVLSGLLEVRIATDKIDQELNYSYDIALAALLRSRGRSKQRTYEANFMQTGTLVAIAKVLFLKDYPTAASEVLTVTGGIGTALSSLTLLQSVGGKRKMSKDPNSLADFLELDLNKYHFSPLIKAFLDTPSSESSEGKSKKEELLIIWKRDKISAMKLSSNTHFWIGDNRLILLIKTSPR